MKKRKPQTGMRPHVPNKHKMCCREDDYGMENDRVEGWEMGQGSTPMKIKREKEDEPGGAR